jgi:MYXO-CTERM domain-containing protein
MVTTNGSLPPQIITVGSTSATVGVAYQYDADLMIHARAEGPVTFSTGPGTPSALRVDPQSGLVTWTPTKSDVGTQRLSFLATSAGGAGPQAFDVTVSAGKGGGGCSLAPSSTPAGAWSLLLLLLAPLVGRRRRRHVSR